MWIKASNGNVLEIADDEHAKRALADGHEVFESNPKDKGAKPWSPPVDDAENDEK